MSGSIAASGSCAAARLLEDQAGNVDSRILLVPRRGKPLVDRQVEFALLAYLQGCIASMDRPQRVFQDDLLERVVKFHQDLDRRNGARAVIRNDSRNIG